MIQKFEFKETEIKGLIEVTPFNADDIRGCFTKDYSKEVFEANGIKSILPRFSIRQATRALSVHFIFSVRNSSPSWYVAYTDTFTM